MILSDNWIIEQCPCCLKSEFFRPMIEPFYPNSVREVDGQKIISFGTSSYGYDAKLAEDLRIFTNTNVMEIDPANFDKRAYVDAKLYQDPETGRRYALLPPNGFMLGHTEEYYVIPRDVLVICTGKSTYARSGIAVIVTPLEPEWEGQVVIEIVNNTPLPARIYVGEGICQFMFFKGDQPCGTSYKDRGGKYQGQMGITDSKV